MSMDTGAVYRIIAQSEGTSEDEVRSRYEKGLVNQLGQLNTSENKPTAKAFLNMAETDFKASDALYENGLFGASIFHLQQGVEKVSKSIFFLDGMNPNRMAFNHNIAKLYSDWSNSLNANARRAHAHHQMQNEMRTRVVVTSLTCIVQVFINSIDPTVDFVTLFSDRNYSLPSYIQDNGSRIRNLASADIQNLLARAGSIGNSELGIEGVRAYDDILKNTEKLFTMALLTVAHESTTRYPIGDSLSETYDYYPALGIVECRETLIEEARRASTAYYDLIS